jgi:hypothetical protein
MTKSKIMLALLLTAISAGAPAIIIRHDVSDASYRRLAERYRMTVVEVAVPGKDGKPNRGNGVGTLVAPEWVLTAHHVASRIMPGHPTSRVAAPHSVYVNGRPYLIESVFLHPDRSEERPWVDIALIKLAKPVRGAKPACLYPNKDEVGKVAVLVGNGQTGTGLTGPVKEKDDALFRGATVLIEGTEANETVIWWPFRGPDDPKVTAMEGISGPGDSGGPAFLTHLGKLCIAGVSAAQDNRGLGEGRYTVREFYPRVSHYRPWLLKVMRREPGR